MDLAFNLLLTLLLEIPIIGFFYRSKKRSKAYLAAFLINIITWPIVNIIILNTNWFDKERLFNPVVQLFVIAIECGFYFFFLKSPFRKVLLMTLVANLVSMITTFYVKIPPDYFQKKNDMIIRP